MPIYAYKCASCGFGQDEMQKIADAPMTVCPSCGKPEYVKQLSAAGFQLKGSGWYATDFKGGSGGNKTGGAEKKEASPTPAPTTPAASGISPK